MELEEGQPFGPYRIVARIGRGGMAEVYLAQRTGPGGFARDLVIKRILPHLAADPEFVRMFVNEAAILARLTHSNIAQVYDFGRIDKDYYLAMEYVRGTSLDRLFAVVAGTGLPVPLAVRVTAEIARGLDYAHRATDAHGRPLNVVHSDVSPSNVLISFEGEVKLIDFGIARARGGRDDALRGTIKGKVRYMSPEQSRGLPLDPRTDVFSLGVLMWEALTGANLFDQDDPTEVLEAVQRRPAPKPSSCRSGVPDALDTIALRAVEKEPEDRFQRADEFAQALDMFLTEHRLMSTDQQLAELVRSRFAPTLLVSLRDEPIKPRPPAAVAPATLVAVPDATKSAVSVPDTVRDPGTVRDAAPGPELRPPTAFEMAATMIDAAPALPSPRVAHTPLPVRDEARPSTSVIVAEPVPGARQGDSARVAAQVPASARGGDSERVDVQAVSASPSRAGDSERLQVQAVPITDARRRSGTTTGWFVSAWHTWSRGTRIALGLAGGGVLFAVALILFVVLTGGPPASTADAPAATAAIPPPADASGPQPIGPVAAADVASPSADAAGPTPDAEPPVAPDAGPVPDANGTAAVDAPPAADVPADAVVADDAPRGDAGRVPERDAAPTTGRVTINSRPWSVVRWRDRTLGETPVIDAVLPPGVQTFLMTDEAGVEHRCSVRVQPGGSVRIRFDLEQDCR